MKEPIEFSLASVAVVLILMMIMNVLTVYSQITSRIENEAASFMSKILLSSGLPTNWDEERILGNELLDFGLASLDKFGLDKDKVNLISYAYLGSIVFPIENALYLNFEELSSLILFKDRSFILEFNPALNISINIVRVGRRYRVEVTVFDLKGENVTDEASLTYVIVYLYGLSTRFLLYVGGSLSPPINGMVLAVAVVAEVNGVKSMAYWINDIMFFGVVVGSYIISPLPLLFARIRLLFYEEIGEDYMCTVNYELVRSVNGLYIYRITGDGWNSSVLHNIDDKAVMVVATSTFIDTIICIYFTYPAPIYSYRGLSSHVKLRYGARALPLEFSVVGELMYIGDMLYEVKLYMWRTVK